MRSALLSQAAPIIWPNDPVVGYALAGVGVVVAVVAVSYLVAHREKGPTPDRVLPTLPMPEPPDEEINLQQAYQLICNRIGLTYRGDKSEIGAHLQIFHDLRQKARDGTIVIRGRQQPFGAATGIYAPREDIAREHWRKMDLEAIRYIFGDTEELIRETATDPDHDHDRQNPEPYFDLVVSRKAIEREWPQKS